MYCVDVCYTSIVIQLYLTNQEGSIHHQKKCVAKIRLPRLKPYMKFLIRGTTMAVNSL